MAVDKLGRRDMRGSGLTGGGRAHRSLPMPAPTSAGRGNHAWHAAPPSHQRGGNGGFEHRRASRLLADTGGSYHLVAPAPYTLIAKKNVLLGGILLRIVPQ